MKASFNAQLGDLTIPLWGKWDFHYKANYPFVFVKGLQAPNMGSLFSLREW